MKTWATLAAASILAGSALATGTTTDNHSSGKWTINVGLFIPTGDHEDAGVDNGFMVGADWMLWSGGAYQNMSGYVGLLGMFGSGDNDLDSTTYGIHYGILFALGENQGMSDLAIKLQGGYYNTTLEAGSSEADDWGFGGLAGLVWKPKNGQFSLEAGYYFMPEVEDTDHRGWFFQVGIPIK